MQEDWTTILLDFGAPNGRSNTHTHTHKHTNTNTMSSISTQHQHQQRQRGGVHVVRPDGRLKDGVLRPLGCEMSCLSQADGSALWRCGGTHVLGAVYGPVAPQNQTKEHGSRAVLSIIIKSGNGNSGGGGGSGDNEFFESQYEMSDFLHRTLSCCIDIERYPRCVIEIVLQIVQSDGSVLGALLHAAVAALMDGGIDLLYLPVATTCLVLVGDDDTSNGGEENGNVSDTIVRTVIRLDPTSEEEEDGDCDSSLLVLVTKQPDDLENSSSIIGSHTVGPGISVNDMLSCMNVASKASKAIAAFWRLAVEQKLTRESQTLWSK